MAERRRALGLKHLADDPLRLRAAAGQKEPSMLRSPFFMGSALCALIGAGCDDVAHLETKAQSAQAEADNKIAAAAREASDKALSAQSEADKKIAEAEANIQRLREDYRHTTASNLLDLDQKVADLEVKANQAKGKAKAEYDNKIQQIRASRAAFVADYKALDIETGAAWDAAKTRLDKEWVELKALLE
jgi:cell division septum initiation protein DivIVA